MTTGSLDDQQCRNQYAFQNVPFLLLGCAAWQVSGVCCMLLGNTGITRLEAVADPELGGRVWTEGEPRS